MNNQIPKIIIAVFLILAVAGCSKKDTITNLPAINSDNNKVVGASANDLLSSSKYNSIKIEIQYMPGFQPDAVALTNLTFFLNSLAYKPGGITIIQTPIASAGKTVLSLTDIATI